MAWAEIWMGGTGIHQCHEAIHPNEDDADHTETADYSSKKQRHIQQERDGRRTDAGDALLHPALIWKKIQNRDKAFCR